MIGTIEDASLIRLENTGALTWRDPAVLGFSRRSCICVSVGLFAHALMDAMSAFADVLSYDAVFVSVCRRNSPRGLCQNCVTSPPQTWGQHQHLRGQAPAHRCCGKSLIGSALVGFEMRQHAARESISKRAPSPTRTSLRI